MLTTELLTAWFDWIYELLRYKFDDERVTKEDPKRAMEEQYGGEEEVVILFIMVVAFDPYEHLSTCYWFNDLYVVF